MGASEGFAGGESYPPSRNPETEPIAIIGIGCRFPGDARSPEDFWRLLCNGVDAITEVPADRFDIEAVYDPRPGTPGKLCTRWGGFVEQVDQFAASFFGISPREADRMDPQQRLLLEVAWEALEDAGQVVDRLAGSRAGVFIGVWTTDYGDLQFYRSDPASISIYVTTGSTRGVLAGRLSYVLGLHGPSVTVDTACSSSLVAVHLACQSLRSGESTLALAGGVNLIMSPEPSLGFSQAKMLAPDGRCKFGDARADGFVRSDGVGVVVLKPLSLALADKDPIYAVIRGSAVNNDGGSSGYLATPGRHSQEELLRVAYQVARVPPGRVQYIEAHGTGTIAGDPVEIQALGAVLSQDRPKDRPCAIGSVKTNIGHAEGAAGIAGLIKAALCLKHRALPPSLHFHEPNPNIPWGDLPLVIQRELTPWPVDSRPALAGVSSFGISATNAHVVLEEAPKISIADHEPLASANKVQLLTLSAHSPEAVEAMVRAYQAFAAANREEVASSLQDVCYTASVRRTHHEHRLALVVHSQEELAQNLDAFLQGEIRPGMSSGRNVPGRKRKLVFVFPGQGSQWLGMGRELLEQEPVFRATLEKWDQAIRQHVGWSLLEELAADEAQSRFDEVDVIQPTLVAIEVGLAALWRSWGIEPDAVVGQSMGEVAAAHVAGVLSLEDAARIICHRSRLVKTTSGKGGMAVVGLSLEEARRALAGYEDVLSIAVSNSPGSTVLSGDTAALKDLSETLERQDILCRLVKVDYASHSPQMDPLRTDLLHALQGLQPQPASLAIYSTVTGDVRNGLEFDAAYWWRNLREPVLFSAVAQTLVERGHDIFLEISPHPIVQTPIQQVLQSLGRESAVLPSLRRGEEERALMLGSLGALYTEGYPVDWSRLYPSGGRCVRLPSYPWQRERFSREDQQTSDSGIQRRYSARRGGGHPLLGRCLRSAAHTGTHFWEMELSPEIFPYLDDHRLQGMVVLPAAVYLEMALAAAKEAFGSGSHVLEKVTFKKALVLPEDGTQAAQLVISPEMPGTTSFQFFSRQADGRQQEASWTLYATGTIRLGQADLAVSAAEHSRPEDVQARCREAISGAEHYRAMQERGLQYGPSFQGVERLWRQDGEAIGQLHLSETVASEAGAYLVHPALLDACFQVLAATLPGEDIYLPVGLGILRVYDPPRPEAGLWSRTLLRSGVDSNADTLEGDIFLLDEGGRVVLEALGLRLQRLGRDAQPATQPDLSNWAYEMRWQPKARLQPDQGLKPVPPDQQDRWLIFADSRDIGRTLRSLLEERGEACVMVFPGETYKLTEPGHYQLNPARPEDLRQLVEDTFGRDDPPCRGVIHLWSLDAAPPEESTLASLETAQVLGCGSVLHLVQALAKVNQTKSPRLWLVTRGVQAVGSEVDSVSVAQSPLWGLGRAISHEHPELRCTNVDLSPSAVPGEISSLFEEVRSGNHEDQIAIRDDARYVARLVRPSPDILQTTPQGSADEKRPFVPERDQNFRLEISQAGILDNLTLRATTRRDPDPGEVEIQVLAAGLNFLDVMKAMGVYPGLEPGAPIALGAECAGKITALGDGVEGFQVGDEVIAITPSFDTSLFRSFVSIPVSLVVPKPAHLSFEEAATIPIAFLTAYYALHHVGRLCEGERVLIHAASGGVGLAAIQLAKQAGAEIFATAGSPEKREFLRSLGVKHVMDSRSLTFADEVMELTGGKGVDVVLNSLAGEAIPRSLSILGPYGRFLEIGKRDIYQNSQLGLRPFQNNLSFFAIALDRAVRERPGLIGSLFVELMQSFEDRTLNPLPLRAFPISEALSAFRYMAQAKHIGKIVVSLQDQEVLVAASSEIPPPFRSDGTYLVTGGLGGLGLSVAGWMVQKGARHLVLMGRGGASAEAQESLEGLENAGAQVVVAKADVAQRQQVADVLAHIHQSMPPLRGIIHAAGILDDGILLQLDQARFQSVMAPKVSGAWNLHTLTLNTPLDFFVLFSSAASLLGSPGQGNYSAANAFLDALAHHRRAQGHPALSINWGPWSEVGLAARPDRGGRLALRGLESLTPRQGVEVLGQLLGKGRAQVGVMHANWQRWCQFYPSAKSSPLLAHLVREDAELQPGTGSPSGSARLSRDALLATEPGARQRLLESYLGEDLAKVLGLSKARLSKLNVHQPLNKLGIDSLMAVELKNRIQVHLGVDVPVLLFLQGPTVAELAKLVLDQLTGAGSPPAALLAPADQLSELTKKADLFLVSVLSQLAEPKVQKTGDQLS